MTAVSGINQPDIGELAASLKAVLPDPREALPGLKSKGKGEVAGPCPICGGDDRFFIRGDGSFMCRQCDFKGGDRLDYYGRIDGLDFNGLVKRYLSSGGNGAKQSRPETDFKKTFERQARNRLPAEALEYFKSRGLAEVVPLLQSKGVIGWHPKERALTFPMFDPRSGAMVGIQRIPVDGGRKKTWPGSSMRDGLLLIDGEQSKSTIIVEGVMDGLSARVSGGYPAIIVFSASTVEKLENTEIDSPVLFFDRDAAGHAAARKVARILPRARAIDWALAPGVCGDVNDLLRGGHREAINRMVETARPLAIETQSVTAANEWEPPVPFDAVNAPPIPPEAVPEPLRSFCLAVAESIQVPFELPVVAALGAVASAAQGKFHVRVKEGYPEQLSLYSLTVLPPGERKSAVLEKFKRPVIDFEAKMDRDFRPRIDAARSELATRKRQIEALRKSTGRKGADIDAIVKQVRELENLLPAVPIVPRVFVDDITPEGLAGFLADHDGRAAVMEAEGGLFEIISGLYSGGSSNINNWLKAWGGESIRVDRRTKDPIVVNAPALTLSLLVQPEVLQDIGGKPGFRGRGLLGRFLYVLPRSRLGTREVESAQVPLQVEGAYCEALLRILEAEWAVDAYCANCPRVIEMSPQAYDAWVEFSRSIEAELRDGGEFEFLRDWAGKLPGQAVRIAGLYHVSSVENPVGVAISGGTMGMALDLAAILAEHAKAAFGCMGSDPAVECARRILKWIKVNNIEQFNAREAFNIVRGDQRFKKMELITPGLAELEARGFIRQAESEPTKRRGRRSSPLFKTNPLAHNSQNPQN